MCCCLFDKFTPLTHTLLNGRWHLHTDREGGLWWVPLNKRLTYSRTHLCKQLKAQLPPCCSLLGSGVLCSAARIQQVCGVCCGQGALMLLVPASASIGW